MALDQECRSALTALATHIATSIPSFHIASSRTASPVVECNQRRHLAGGWAVPAAAATATAAAT